VAALALALAFAFAAALFGAIELYVQNARELRQYKEPNLEK